MGTFVAANQSRLNAEYLKTAPELIGPSATQEYPERVLQFGEGAFLRGFVDWMIHGLNERGLFGGKVVVVQPIAQGMVDRLNEQNGVYTLLMRGLENGKAVERQEIITSISRGINPYTEFQQYLRCAHNPDLRFVVSNTTEAGIVFNASDKVTDAPPSSFPAKLTRFLLERYIAFDGDSAKGFVILPCELIDRNGDNLKQAVLQTIDNWGLEEEFTNWVQSANVFTNTLVDRIVTGYPKDEIEALSEQTGYQDDLFDTSELFHLWVIEGPASIGEELPLAQAGFNVVITDNMKPYRDRKVGILNGAHTSMALAAYLSGFDYVGDSIKDPVVAEFLKRAVYDEIIPTLTLPRPELELFAEAVFERFANPAIRHALLSIALNSVSKYKARVLPTVDRYFAAHKELPNHLVFGLAALIAFYRGTEISDGMLTAHRNGQVYKIKDDLPVLNTFALLWREFQNTQSGIRSLADSVLQQATWWGKDLRDMPALTDAVAGHLGLILNRGARNAMLEMVR